MLGRSVVLVVGEALVDVVRRHDGTVAEHAGGSSANTAVALSRLGREVWFATALGDDARGRLLLEHLTANQVRLPGDPFVLARTATAVATLAGDGSATYDFDLEWRVPEVVLPAGRDPAAVVYGSLGAALSPGADAVAHVVEEWRGRALTVLDLNVRPAVTGVGPGTVARAERMAALADVVKASDEDLEALWPGRDHGAVAADLMSAGSGAVVVTRGAHGARWFAPEGDVATPAPATRVVDTIGAGDTVTAALVHGLLSLGASGPGAAARLREVTPEGRVSVLGFATRAAAVTVSRAGADPPWLRELGQ